VAVRSPGKSPLLVAEELAFDEVFGNGSAVDLDEGTRSPAAVSMKRPGHQFLAGAVFSGDEHAGVGGGHQVQRLPQLADGLTLADNLPGRRRLLPQPPVFFGQAGQFQAISHREENLVGVRRLFDKVIGPQAGGFDGVFHRAVGGNDHHRQEGVMALQFLEHLQAVQARQGDVQQHQVRGLLAHQLDGGLPIRGRNHLEAFIPKDTRDHLQDLGLVVNY